MYNVLVIRSFSDAGTADLLYGADTKAARRFPKELWPRIQRKLIILDTAKQRLTFRFVGPDCHEVRCEDYH